jgi:hypothetical protein
MSKRRGAGTSRARAIRNTLARLGMQASPKQVVATLAGCGIEVDEALVRRVKIEMLKEAAQVDRHQRKAPPAERPKAQRPPKVPPRHGHRA